MALPAFYLFAKKFQKRKYSVVIALVLFSLNYQIVYYSVEFKQYSRYFNLPDCIFIFERFNIKQTVLKNILAGLLWVLGFLFCIPSIFITGGYLLCNLKNLKEILKTFDFLTARLSFLCRFITYSLYPSRLEDGKALWKSFGKSGFITLNPLSILIILKENIQFFLIKTIFTCCCNPFSLTGFCDFKTNKKQKDVKGKLNSAYLL